MIREPARRGQLNLFLAVACVLLAAVVASYAVTALSGTKTGVALALMAIGGPVMAYIAIVAPLIFPFGLYVVAVPFDNILNITAFGTLTKLLAIVSGAAILLYVLRTRKAVAPPKSLLVWVALYAWAATTTFWAIDQKTVFALLPTSIELLILYAAISILPADRKAIVFLGACTVVGGVLAATYGAYLFHNGVDIYYGGRLRITTDSGAIDPNHFAAALLLPIGLCINNLLNTRKWSGAIVSLTATCLLMVGIMLSSSRGAILAIGVMFVYFFFRSKGRWRLATFVGAIAVCALIFAPQTDLWNRFGMALSTGGAGRTSIWHVGLVALKTHWLLGAGYNNFPFAYDQAFLQTPHQIYGISDWHRGPHNLLVGTAVELGVVGLFLTLAAWVAQFRTLRNIGPDEPEYGMRVALEATVIGTFVASLFLDVMVFKYVWLTFMFIALVRNYHLQRRSLNA
jgi:O-antigen ligase